MKKRQMKKNIKNLLTTDELIVLELYRQCGIADFYRYNNDFDSAHKFAKTLDDNVGACEGGGSKWLRSKKGKIKATAFLKEVQTNE